MANLINIISLRCVLRTSFRNNLTTSNNLNIGFRNLYTKLALGIDNFVEQKNAVTKQMANIAERFREKMNLYASDDGDSRNLIFTEDLKNMIHLSDNDQDFELVVKMMKKFNQQNKQLRFGSFVFGPVVMRLFHLHNKADLAFECFKDEKLNGFFDQLISYQILLDLLYENEKYEDILKAYELIKAKQIENVKHPRNVIVLVLAACYKLNSKSSFTFALDLWKELMEAGHLPMRRATTFMAGLALKQGRPEITIEVLENTRNQNYTTVRNLKVAALVECGRIEEAVNVLKSIINQDEPSNTKQTFNKDVLAKVKASMSNVDNPDIVSEFNRLEKLFEKQGSISDLSMDDQLCSEIQPPPMVKNRQSNNYSRFDEYNKRSNQGYNRFGKATGKFNRPGLQDLV